MMHLESDHAQPFPVVMFYLVTCIKVTCVFCDLILFYELLHFIHQTPTEGALVDSNVGQRDTALCPSSF